MTPRVPAAGSAEPDLIRCAVRRCRRRMPALLLGLVPLASCTGDRGAPTTTDPTACRSTPDLLDFGSVAVGQTRDLSFTIRNAGPGAVRGHVSEGCPAFQIVSGGGTYTLSAGQDARVTIRFAPPVAGSHQCAVDLGTTACGSLACRGTGEEPDPPLPSGMILIPEGAFTMGSPRDEPGRYENEVQHPVTLTQAVYVCDHEVTQAEWGAVMRWNESVFRSPNRPVENVTWFDAVDYCNERSIREGYLPAYTMAVNGRDGNHIIAAAVIWNRQAGGYRLLTEAEWEYACRAGATSELCNGEIVNLGCAPLDPGLDQVGWYCGNASSSTHAPGGKAANAWGLRDMHGNVWEWCWDWYADAPESPAADPAGPASGTSRLIRGGCWGNSARYCRCACRLSYVPGTRYSTLGLRVARRAR